MSEVISLQDSCADTVIEENHVVKHTQSKNYEQKCLTFVNIHFNANEEKKKLEKTYGQAIANVEFADESKCSQGSTIKFVKEQKSNNGSVQTISSEILEKLSIKSTESNRKSSDIAVEECSINKSIESSSQHLGKRKNTENNNLESIKMMRSNSTEDFVNKHEKERNQAIKDDGKIFESPKPSTSAMPNTKPGPLHEGEKAKASSISTTASNSQTEIHARKEQNEEDVPKFISTVVQSQLSKIKPIEKEVITTGSSNSCLKSFLTSKSVLAPLDMNTIRKTESEHLKLLQNFTEVRSPKTQNIDHQKDRLQEKLNEQLIEHDVEITSLKEHLLQSYEYSAMLQNSSNLLTVMLNQKSKLIDKLNVERKRCEEERYELRRENRKLKAENEKLRRLMSTNVTDISPNGCKCTNPFCSHSSFDNIPTSSHINQNSVMLVTSFGNDLLSFQNIPQTTTPVSSVLTTQTNSVSSGFTASHNNIENVEENQHHQRLE